MRFTEDSRGLQVIATDGRGLQVIADDCRAILLACAVIASATAQAYEGEAIVVLVSPTGQQMKYATSCKIFETEEFRVLRFESIKIDIAISKKDNNLMVVDSATKIVWNASKADMDSMRETNLKSIESALSFAAGNEKKELENIAARYAVPGTDAAQLSEAREGATTTYKITTGSTTWLSVTAGAGDGVFPVFDWLAELGVVPRVKGENRAIKGIVEKLSFRFVAGNYLISISFSEVKNSTDGQDFKMPEKYQSVPLQRFQRFNQTEIPEAAKDGKK